MDVGGKSTRLGAAPVGDQEELRRIVPVIEALAAEGVKVSVDTRKAAVARAAVAAGATLLNDVSGALGPVAAELGVPWAARSEEHTSELQSLMRISYAVFCLKKKHTTIDLDTLL